MNSQHMHHIRDMWDKIDSLHLSYLQTEECLKKIGEQSELEDVIRQYLSLVSHIEKFFFPKISYVLHNSIRDNKDFSPFKVISAWFALVKYAHNILTQPWRKEFYSIQKYGGYFSHVIKEVLVDWEIVFELMGYNTARDTMILQEPIDPDKITFVARDCFIAQVECQIMMKIYSNVLKVHNDCTWQDVLEFRETNICSADQAVRSLCSLFMQRQQEEYARETCAPTLHPYGYSAMPPFQSPCMRFNNYKQATPYGNSLVGIPSHPRMSHEKCDYTRLMPQDYSYNNCPKHIPNPVPLNDPSYIPQYQANGYGMPYPDKALCPQYIFPNNTVPFVDLDMHERDHCSNCHGYNYGNMYPCIYGNNKFVERSYDFHKQKSKNVSKYDNSSKQNPTDYLHKKNKDSFVTTSVKRPPVTVTDLENAMKAFSYDFDKNSVSDNEQSDKSQVSTNSVSESVPISPEKPNKFVKNESTAKNESTTKTVITWECKTCTFHNQGDNSICELCGKSKNAGSEKIPLISGGRHCHVCTLVNGRDAKRCEACSTDLEDSPTYI